MKTIRLNKAKQDPIKKKSDMGILKKYSILSEICSDL